MLETHRRLYNSALDGRILCWETANSNLSYADQCKWFVRLRRQTKWYAAINCQSGVRTLRRLDKAYKAFFKRRGFPRFKSKAQFKSFDFVWGDGAALKNNKLRIQFVGELRVKWHRPLPEGGVIKQCKLLLDGDKWYVIFSVEMPRVELPTPPQSSVGIDLGLRSFATTSEGEQLGDSSVLERNLKSLRAKQRALSRCKKGSNSRKKVKKRVTRLHAKIRNTRRDTHHKVARSLVDRFGVIAMESLNIQGMVKNRRLSRRILDAGWHSFLQILTYKAESAGGRVILVDPKNTSQLCSGCGKLVPKALHIRVHECDCGLTLDRDVNAARNILARAEPGFANVGSVLLEPEAAIAV
jgi:putative transposase